MNENIRINVKGTNKDSGVVEVECSGRYALVGDVEYIRYEECLEEADIKINNLIKLRRGSMEMIKKGPMNSRMTFAAGQTTSCTYDTPYGSIPMQVHTRRMDIIRTDDRLRVILQYSLGMDGGQDIDCEVDINVESL